MKKLIITMETYVEDKYVDLYIQNIGNLIVTRVKGKNVECIKEIVNDESNIIMVNLGEI